MEYMYIWEYFVDPQKDASFREFYGPDGPWVRLFCQGEGYVGTRLYRDRQRRGRYVTVDRWKSHAAFRKFKDQFANEVDELDRTGATLTLRERPLGQFQAIDDDHQ